MDPRESPVERFVPLQGPHWRTGRASLSAARHTASAQADFKPLRLVLEAGGLTIELTEPDMLVGRHSEADVRLPLPDVSRRHCRFLFREGIWQITDLQSLNGVYVNGEQVQEAALQDGDTLGIGSCHFKVRIGGIETRGAARAQDVPERTEILPHLSDRGTTQRKAS
jgi:pSer/pThr/pTyr-binding forkhead associated (FHA) protein